ncbi:MAG: methionine aminotransferase [Xanthomonadales bacterium]|nr:methionine aminotransferase [Xanthomonadales bacterium]
MDAHGTGPGPVEKLPGFGTTIFTVMSQLAAEHDAINLAQGFPDFDGPKALRDRVEHHLAAGHNQYAPLAGVTALREAIARKVQGLYGFAADPERHITVTPGATEAIYCALTAVVHAGDEVIVIDPAYDTYVPGILLNGGVPHRIPLRDPGFGVDWARVEEAISPRTRVLMLNSPHNPSGRCFDSSDIDALRDIMARHDLLLISDEVYEHIVFDGRRHLSILCDRELAERAFVVSSFGKTYHVTGWRIGYCVAPGRLMAQFRRVHQFINFSTNTPISCALADFMRDAPEFHRELAGFYQKKRDLFCTLLNDSRFRLAPAEGTYFQLADYARISDLPDTEFARELTIQHGVAAIPVSVFYESPPESRVVRFCFAKEDDTLREAARRIASL